MIQESFSTIYPFIEIIYPSFSGMEAQDQPHLCIFLEERSIDT